MEEAQLRKLFEAGAKGCISSMKQLMIDDPGVREDLKLLVKSLSESKDGGGKRKKSLEETLKEWLDKKKNAMMVVASLLATMCFQIGVCPPGGVWQDDNYLMDSRGNNVDPNGNPISFAVDSQNKSVAWPHRAGYAVLARNDPSAYEEFYIYNTIGFVSSLSIIFLLMSGLPVRCRCFMWILLIITWIAISATAMTYNTVVVALTPNNNISDVIQYSLYAWSALTLLIFIAHVIRLLLKLLKNLLQALVKLLKLPLNCCKALVKLLKLPLNCCKDACSPV